MAKSLPVTCAQVSSESSFLLGFILVQGPLLPHNLRGPPPWALLLSAPLSSSIQGSGCASLQEHRLCFLKMILKN